MDKNCHFGPWVYSNGSLVIALVHVSDFRMVLGNVELIVYIKLLGLISDVNIDNCAKFCQLTTPRRYILKTSYLSVLGLCRPIIYRPDDLFQFLLQILHLPMELDVW